MFGLSKRVHYVNFPELNMKRSHSVVGESYNQANLAAASRWELAEDQSLWVSLRAEPSNPNDRNAIRVDIIRPDGSGWLKVGYIAREETAAWHPVIASAPRGTVWAWPAELMGGSGVKSFGIYFMG